MKTKNKNKNKILMIIKLFCSLDRDFLKNIMMYMTTFCYKIITTKLDLFHNMLLIKNINSINTSC